MIIYFFARISKKDFCSGSVKVKNVVVATNPLDCRICTPRFLFTGYSFVSFNTKSYMEKYISKKENLQELFTSLDDVTSELVKTISLFSDTQINAIPFRGSWTAAQVADHITKSNLGIVRSLRTEGKLTRRDADERVKELKEQFLNFAEKLQSPKFILPTQDIYQKEKVIADLKRSIEHLKEISSVVNLYEALNHPIFGDITRLELFHFVVYHTQRHLHQLRNIFRITSTAKPNIEMRKIISFMHVSLDGFVAGVNGEMNWITMDDEIFEDAIALAATTGTALYGRTTYQMMESYWPTVLTNPTSTKNEIYHADWVENVNKIVFSTSLEKVEWNNTRLIKKNIKEEVTKLKQESGKNMMIFGSPRLTHSFMQMGLIDEYRINVNPVLLGNGIPLFKNLSDRINLKLLKTRTFESGVTGLHYETKRN
jgi:dihydrofolate reductase